MTKDEYISKATEIISVLNHSHIEKYTMIMILKMLVQNDKKRTEFSENDLNCNFLEEIHNDSISDSKNLRKLLNLPVTKELRYMKREHTSFTPYNLKSYQIADWYTESNSASLELILENGKTVRILGDYFSHM